MTSGPNRILTFAANKIPVVSDMYPSACQVINHEKNGFLAFSESGWYNSIEKLINSPKLREYFSKEMHQKFKSDFDFEKQNERFLKDLTYLQNNLKKRESNIKKPKSTEFSIKPFIYFLLNELYQLIKKQLKIFLR